MLAALCKVGGGGGEGGYDNKERKTWRKVLGEGDEGITKLKTKI